MWQPAACFVTCWYYKHGARYALFYKGHVHMAPVICTFLAALLPHVVGKRERKCCLLWYWSYGTAQRSVPGSNSETGRPVSVWNCHTEQTQFTEGNIWVDPVPRIGGMFPRRREREAAVWWGNSRLARNTIYCTLKCSMTVTRRFSQHRANQQTAPPLCAIFSSKWTHSSAWPRTKECNILSENMPPLGWLAIC